MGELNIQVKVLKGRVPILFTWWNKELDSAESCLITCLCQNLGLREGMCSGKRKRMGKEGARYSVKKVTAVNLCEALEQAEIVSIPIEVRSGIDPENGPNETLVSDCIEESSPDEENIQSAMEEVDGLDLRSGHSEGRNCRNFPKVESNRNDAVEKEIANNTQPEAKYADEAIGDDRTKSQINSHCLPVSEAECVKHTIIKERSPVSKNKQLSSQNLGNIDKNDNDGFKTLESKEYQTMNNNDLASRLADDIPNHSDTTLSSSNNPSQDPADIEVMGVSDGIHTKVIDVGGISSDAVVVVSDSREISDVESLFRALKGIIEHEIPQEGCNGMEQPERMQDVVQEEDLHVNTRMAMLKYEEHQNELYLKKLHQKPKSRCAETAICEVCGAIANTRTIKKHMSAFHPTGLRVRKYACEVCDKKFYRAENRDRHRRLHSEPSFHCQQCGRSFRQAYQLKAHDKTHSGYRPPPRIRRPAASRSQRVDVENGKTTTTCKKCCSKLDIKNLKGHMEIVHGLQAPSFECTRCGKKFSTASNLKIHKLAHTGLTYKCSFCEDTFNRNKDRLTHERAHVDASSMCGKLRFKCGYCEKTYSRQTDRIRHEMTHVDDTIDASHVKNAVEETTVLIDCHICGKTLKQQSMRNHMASHNHKTWTCNVCGKVFTYSYRYQHAKLHQENKPQACLHCPARFHSKSSLVVHLRKHTKEKPIPCRYCDRTFSRHGARNNHERLHTGERPYQCDICNKGWRDRPTYLQHMLKHHPGVPLMKWRKTNHQQNHGLEEIASS